MPIMCDGRVPFRRKAEIGGEEGRCLHETPHRRQRRTSPYYYAGRRGFDAGYLGQPKPSLP
jgi:hypothetical protein